MLILFSAVAALIHVWIFLMESFLWGTPKINKAFNMTPQQAEENKTFAFNQGFYNLFLSIAIFSGIYFIYVGHESVGNTLVIYSCASMVGASLVLLKSNKKLIRAALIQGLPPFLSVVSFFL